MSISSDDSGYYSSIARDGNDVGIMDNSESENELINDLNNDDLDNDDLDDDAKSAYTLVLGKLEVILEL